MYFYKYRIASCTIIFQLTSLCPKGQKKPILMPFVNNSYEWKYTQNDLKYLNGPTHISYYLSSIGYETCSSETGTSSKIKLRPYENKNLFY